MEDDVIAESVSGAFELFSEGALHPMNAIRIRKEKKFLKCFLEIIYH